MDGDDLYAECHATGKVDGESCGKCDGIKSRTSTRANRCSQHGSVGRFIRLLWTVDGALDTLWLTQRRLPGQG